MIFGFISNFSWFKPCQTSCPPFICNEKSANYVFFWCLCSHHGWYGGCKREPLKLWVLHGVFFLCVCVFWFGESWYVRKYATIVMDYLFGNTSLFFLVFGEKGSCCTTRVLVPLLGCIYFGVMYFSFLPVVAPQFWLRACVRVCARLRFSVLITKSIDLHSRENENLWGSNVLKAVFAWMICVAVGCRESWRGAWRS